MQAAYTISYSINRRRPRQRTREQSEFVNNDPAVRFLLNQQEHLKRTLPNETQGAKYEVLTLQDYSREAASTA